MATTIKKTGNYLLKGGTLVLNKTQLGRIRKAKTQKTVTKIINQVKRRRPKLSKTKYKISK